MANHREPDRFETAQEALDPHRRETRDAAAAELVNKLAARGVRVSGDESSDEIADLLDAVERFERAVQSRGGDLMVDERPLDEGSVDNEPAGRPRQPDDRRFVIPERRADEPIDAYLARIQEATRVVFEHPGRAD
jgi:hypothetical protein